MNANLKCSNCGSQAQVKDYNIARIGSNCYVCGRWNSVSELLRNVYGETVGKLARTLVAKLEGPVKQADLREQIASSESRIERAILEMGVPSVS